MKGIFILIGLILLIGLGVYFFGVSGYDPDEQGAAARAAITPGMTWEQVIDATKPPRQFYKLSVSDRAGEDESWNWSGPNKFDLPSFKQYLAGGNMPDGFRFDYVYGSASAFSVVFDGSGKVESVDDLPTASDLFQL